MNIGEHLLSASVSLRIRCAQKNIELINLAVSSAGYARYGRSAFSEKRLSVACKCEIKAVFLVVGKLALYSQHIEISGIELVRLEERFFGIKDQVQIVLTGRAGCGFADLLHRGQ